MTDFTDLDSLKRTASEHLDLGEPIRVKDPDRMKREFIEPLVRAAIFPSDTQLRDVARYLIQEIACASGLWPASIQDLYEARGRGDVSRFTVPAINIRGMTFDVARAALRAALEHRCGTIIFEIARSEIGYTDQRPAEYAAAITAAAIREGFQGPLFIQGDHFQINAKRYARDAESEVRAVKDLIQEAIEARFLNIDIDTSTLVDVSQPTVREQQTLNYELSADLTAFVRHLEPKGVTISVGGEIGEVGKKNSTVEEMQAYMDGYLEELGRRGEALRGISKISVQTGTSHGGVPLADGTIAAVKVDFGVLEQLSRVARDRYGLAGAVQHGASTLPEEAFDRFPTVETAEIHLATGFQNQIYDHPDFPADLKQAVRDHCFEAHVEERTQGQTDEQFLYKTRKKAFGPLKRQLWDLPSSVRESIGRTLEERFGFLYQKLGVVGSQSIVSRYFERRELHSPRPSGL